MLMPFIYFIVKLKAIIPIKPSSNSCSAAIGTNIVIQLVLVIVKSNLV